MARQSRHNEVTQMRRRWKYMQDAISPSSRKRRTQEISDAAEFTWHGGGASTGAGVSRRRYAAVATPRAIAAVYLREA